MPNRRRCWRSQKMARARTQNFCDDRADGLGLYGRRRHILSTHAPCCTVPADGGRIHLQSNPAKQERLKFNQSLALCREHARRAQNMMEAKKAQEALHHAPDDEYGKTCSTAHAAARRDEGAGGLGPPATSAARPTSARKSQKMKSDGSTCRARHRDPARPSVRESKPKKLGWKGPSRPTSDQRCNRSRPPWARKRSKPERGSGFESPLRGHPAKAKGQTRQKIPRRCPAPSQSAGDHRLHASRDLLASTPTNARASNLTGPEDAWTRWKRATSSW